MDRPQILFSWARYYAPLAAFCLAVGVLAGVAYVTLTPTVASASTTVVEIDDKIPPLQLDSIARVFFKSAEVYRPAMRKLDLKESPEVFLRRHTELRPVADTTVLSVIGRAEDQRAAEAISWTMANSLVRALNEQKERPPDYVPPNQEPPPDFIVFSGPEPAPGSGRVPAAVAITLGGAAGFWFGAAVSLLHFAWRRPLLTLQHAVASTGADRLGVIRGRWPAWLGVFRPRLRWKMTARNRLWLARLAELHDVSAVDVEPVGIPFDKKDEISRRLLEDLRYAQSGYDAPRGRTGTHSAEPRASAVAVAGSFGHAGSTGADARPLPGRRAKVIVCHAGASEHEVRQARSTLLGTQSETEAHWVSLLWVT